MRVAIFGAFLFLVGCANTLRIYPEPRQMVVQALVTNVRAKPVEHSGEYKYDPLQETQLERGEPVLAKERRGEWVFVEAPEQLEFTHNNKWEGYPGWVKISALSRNLLLFRHIENPRVPSDELRKLVLEKAALHLGSPYLWGGRSLHQPEYKDVATGVDCSGLVNWSFRQVGQKIPRDAHEQSLRARPLQSEALKPGDLVFLAKEKKPEKVVHVMFFEGGDMFLEAPSSGENVRRISSQERFGKPLSEIKSGDVLGDRIVTFGSFFAD